MQLQFSQPPLCGMLREMESHSTGQEKFMSRQHRPYDDAFGLCSKKYSLVYAWVPTPEYVDLRSSHSIAFFESCSLGLALPSGTSHTADSRLFGPTLLRGINRTMRVDSRFM